MQPLKANPEGLTLEKISGLGPSVYQIEGPNMREGQIGHTDSTDHERPRPRGVFTCSNWDLPGYREFCVRDSREKIRIRAIVAEEDQELVREWLSIFLNGEDPEPELGAIDGGVNANDESFSRYYEFRRDAIGRWIKDNPDTAEIMSKRCDSQFLLNQQLATAARVPNLDVWMTLYSEAMR